MVAAYALALKGISVRVLENAPTCMEDMRASTLHPPTLEMLESLGLRETLEAEGLRAPVYQYSNRTTGRNFTLDMSEIADVTPYPYRLQCEQFKLTRLIAARLAEMPHAEVLFSHAILKVDQGANGVHISAETPYDIKLFSADYLIGADGGNSTVRKWLGIGFDGFTYPETFLTLSTEYPIEQHLPWLKEVNYVSGDPFWCVALRVPGQWRVLVPVSETESDADVTSDARKDDVFAQLLGANVPIETTHRTRYRVHQRVATSFRNRRILLVGDSAHLNNPLGGFGMNSGVHDSMNLADKLGKVILDGAGDELLDLYDRQRRTVTREFVQAQTIANKKAAEETGATSPREQMLARLENDPTARHAYIVEQAMFKSLARAAEIT